MRSRARYQQIYDHRLRELVRRTGDLRLATELGVPRSTALGWVGGQAQPVVSLDVLDMATVDLQAEVVKLRRRVRALVDVRLSNSMIESWRHTLKHQWLYLHPLESVAVVRRYVAFYVAEYNAKIPHAAVQGQTPDEMYYGRGEEVPIDLESARREARRRRLAANRAASCGRSPPAEEVAA